MSVAFCESVISSPTDGVSIRVTVPAKTNTPYTPLVGYFVGAIGHRCRQLFPPLPNLLSKKEPIEYLVAGQNYLCVGLVRSSVLSFGDPNTSVHTERPRNARTPDRLLHCRMSYRSSQGTSSPCSSILCMSKINIDIQGASRLAP